MAKRDKSDMWFLVGRWSYVVGIVLALLASVFGLTKLWVPALLFVLGLLIGFLNITAKEEERFLISSIAFLVGFGTISTSLDMISKVLLFPNFLRTFLGLSIAYLVILVSGAVIVVALRALYTVSKDR